MDVRAAFRGAPYPGRGLAVIRCGDGELALLYWLTGRSEASRRRVLRADSLDLVVQGEATSQVVDPLRHYRAARRVGRHDLVGNGDHVDHLAAALEGHGGALDVWWNKEPEPDPPLHTARILAVVDRTSEVACMTAVRRSEVGVAEHVGLRVAEMPPSTGLAMATYRGDPSQPKPWAEPLWIEAEGTLEAQLFLTWETLDPRYRVALAGRYLETDATWTILAPSLARPE